MAEETQTTETVEIVKNCAGCKKIISRARRYYRNGAYYCNKNCYKKKMAGTVVEVSEEEAKGEGKGKGKDEGKKDAKAEGKAEAKNESKEEAKAQAKEEKAEAKKGE